MITSKNLKNGFFFLLAICVGCVPIQQQIAESEDSEIEGFVGPLVIDQDKFYRVASSKVYDRLKIDDALLPSNNNVTYEGTFDGNMVYIRNCKCLKDVKIIQHKLVMMHSYGGGESNRETTELLWNGKYHQNSKGENIVDLIMHSDKIDVRRGYIHEKKILNVEGVQRKGVSFVWINLVGYDRLIRYAY